MMNFFVKELMVKISTVTLTPKVKLVLSGFIVILIALLIILFCYGIYDGGICLMKNSWLV